MQAETLRLLTGLTEIPVVPIGQLRPDPQRLAVLARLFQQHRGLMSADALGPGRGVFFYAGTRALEYEIFSYDTARLAITGGSYLSEDLATFDAPLREDLRWLEDYFVSLPDLAASNRFVIYTVGRNMRDLTFTAAVTLLTGVGGATRAEVNTLSGLPPSPRVRPSNASLGAAGSDAGAYE